MILNFYILYWILLSEGTRALEQPNVTLLPCITENEDASVCNVEQSEHNESHNLNKIVTNAQRNRLTVRSSTSGSPVVRRLSHKDIKLRKLKTPISNTHKTETKVHSNVGTTKANTPPDAHNAEQAYKNITLDSNIHEEKTQGNTSDVDPLISNEDESSTQISEVLQVLNTTEFLPSAEPEDLVSNEDSLNNNGSSNAWPSYLNNTTTNIFNETLTENVHESNIPQKNDSLILNVSNSTHVTEVLNLNATDQLADPNITALSNLDIGEIAFNITGTSVDAENETLNISDEVILSEDPLSMNSSAENSTKALSVSALRDRKLINSTDKEDLVASENIEKGDTFIANTSVELRNNPVHSENDSSLSNDRKKLILESHEEINLEANTTILNITYVRKCCNESQYFSLASQSCENIEEDLGFLNSVQKILLPNSTEGIEIRSGLLQICPERKEAPIISVANFDTHSLETLGYLKDDAYDVTYDHDHYCLELVGNRAVQNEATLVIAHCYPKTSVRKCCEEHEFYSIITQQCETSETNSSFSEDVEHISSGITAKNLEYITGTLKTCPGTEKPPLVEEAHSYSHSLLSHGHIMNHNLDKVFNHDHYCLELASVDNLKTSQLVLAYCPGNVNEEYKAFPNEANVRKCCRVNEYFSSRTQQCESTETEIGFDEFITAIKGDNSIHNFTFDHGKIEQCPKFGDRPLVTTVNPQSHAVLVTGHLQELSTGITYDHDNYCLEIGANSPDELSNGTLLAAYCPVSSLQIYRKCCNLNQYYDDATYQCLDNHESIPNYKSLIHNFNPNEPGITPSRIRTGSVLCKAGKPKQLQADEIFMDKTGQLCKHKNNVCHPPDSYCMEYCVSESDNAVKPVAFVCPTSFFYKCCEDGEILTEHGCQPMGSDHIHSSNMTQLLQIYDSHIGFHSRGSEICVKSQVSSDYKDLRSLIDEEGYLTMRYNDSEIITKNYCVDDFLDHENNISYVVQMCSSEMAYVLPVDLLAHNNASNSVGKCCPYEDILTIENGRLKCSSNKTIGMNLTKDPHFIDANVTDLVYTSLPKCSNSKGYHLYSFVQQGEDFATFGDFQVLEIVSMEDGCFMSKQSIKKTDFCLDYFDHGKGNQPTAVLCSNLWPEFSKYQEKYSLTAVLLGISCTALVATAISLISMRVRRGLVTVKKVNTLAGRILLSYVLSYLLAYLLLAIAMKQSIEKGPSCSILAGFLLFFLLAAFQWNTSICLESLLLTLRVSASEHQRYLCHSLWSWGIPGIITTIALTLDHHKADLPCSTIIPRIGLYRCFFSDKNAQLLYLYFPMFLSLCANMTLLTAARYVRSAKLKRLEKGVRSRTPASNNDEKQDQSKTSDQNTSQVSQQSSTQHSGLRTHQTRNLWTESMKLVVWSGATWMLEVLSFLLTRFVVLTDSWYNYLWYLPSSINSLRGVGIFIILVLTPENRQKISKVVGRLGTRKGSESMARHSRSVDDHSSSGNNVSYITQGRTNDYRQHGLRNMSIATTLTTFSSIRSEVSADPRPETGSSRVHPRLAHSVSQIAPSRGSESRRGSESSFSSDGETSEAETEFGGGGRRKSSLATYGLVSLPSVDEEDIFDDASTVATVQPSETDSAQSTSFA